MQKEISLWRATSAETEKKIYRGGPEDSGLPSASPALLRRLSEWAPGISQRHIYECDDPENRISHAKQKKSEAKAPGFRLGLDGFRSLDQVGF